MGLGLRSSWGDSPVLARPVVLELIPDHAHHDVVRDEPAGIHNLLGFDAERRLLGDLLA